LVTYLNFSVPLTIDACQIRESYSYAEGYEKSAPTNHQHKCKFALKAWINFLVVYLNVSTNIMGYIFKISRQTYESLVSAIADSVAYETASSPPNESPGSPLTSPVRRRVPTCELDPRPHCCSGYFTVDAIGYYTHLLFQQNVTVGAAQVSIYLYARRVNRPRMMVFAVPFYFYIF
jgi:hypothetical protein